MKSITVVGSGVTGLTTALLLVEKGYNVTIVAKHFPGDDNIEYTSPFAGAHWRTLASNKDVLAQRFDSIAYQKFLYLGRTIPEEQTGIMIAPSYDYYDTLTEDTKNPWFKNVVEDFSYIPHTDFPDSTIKVGHRYTTVLINPLQYLPWLLKQVVSKGVQLKRQTINNIRDAFTVDDGDGCIKSVDAVVNCTGLGSLHLGGVQDQKLFPTRGQTVLVKGNHIKKSVYYVRNGIFTYIIPRADGTIILGGTAEKNDFNAHVDHSTTEAILKRTKSLCPELTINDQPLDIVREAVGFRPTRTGGVRIENERYGMTSGKDMIVTHAYGHGGFGYQSSWGSSEYIVNMVEKGLYQPKL
ncbi:uncharacterized protein BX664DRAFT_321698 [Halteromyces radiatus]|uniref:uncharacterized protein n=1 Tax=Halteromyces radiatus TaxID=101107 RepID=UPI00222129E5|nr:uncharacterized protein BX664DRAFT_321698 [Halteromyces radiatus]KAI8099600.1 hypothetical protein BX664DRAFT_321698 [Halteromyces radiatus]